MGEIFTKKPLSLRLQNHLSDANIRVGRRQKTKPMKMLTVKQAVELVNDGGNLDGVVLDAGSAAQVNVRDAMVLSRGGIVVPEQSIYYDDADIEYDQEIDDLVITSGIVQLPWEEKARRAQAYADAGQMVRNTPDA